MSQSGAKPNPKKMIILMSLGLLIPIFLVSMAYLAVSSDEKNQQKYQQQQAEMLERIKAREAAEQAASKPSVELSEQQASK
jgi:ABC-type transport system involved in cytochrome bd biosynthesis fused ATPase/permease subunit